MNFSLSRTTNLTPAEVFLGMQPTHPAGLTAATPAPLTRDASEEEIAAYAQLVRQRVHS